MRGLTEERKFADLLHRAEPAWLIAAAFLQILTYVCAALMWQRSLARQGDSRALKGLLPLGLAKLFTDQAVPSAGLSGTLLLDHALNRRGVSQERAMGAVFVGLFAYYIAYAVVVAATVLILWLWGDLSR